MSQPLRRAALHAALAGAAGLALYLDFDGTLAPTVEDPDDAALLPAAREALVRLSDRARITLVSGRALADLRRRADLPAVYAGNHGLEIEGPGFQYVEPRAEAAAARLRELCGCLESRLSAFPGVLVEYKTLSASVHYRRVPAERVAHLSAIVNSAVKEYPEFELAGGLLVFNIRPAIDWNKGSAARWIQERCGSPSDAVLCAGNDLTDEDLFAAFPEAVTIAIGCAYHTLARWCAPDCTALAALLASLADDFTLPSPE